MEILPLTESMTELLKDAAANLKGHARRLFMAKTVEALGPFGQSKAERQLGWNRGTIRKGMKELNSGIISPDHFSARGRNRAEDNLPNLLEDIKNRVEPISQTDPTFRTTRLYRPLTANEVRHRLITECGYTDEQLPTARTLSNKLNQLGLHPRRVAKSKPLKKIALTDAIFNELHQVNHEADETEGVLRISIDTKAKVNIGPFSRHGKNRLETKGSDHDFAPKATLVPFGIFLPAYGETFLFFTEGKVTADFMIDCLESIWPELSARFNPHTLVINADNGPENNSARTQFIKRITDFAHLDEIFIKLAYYPPYHSKYNPIERVWGVLENHWNGEILDRVEKALGFAGTMTWNGLNPVVQLVEGTYETGVKLTKKAMEVYEKMIERLDGLEKGFITIKANPV